MQKMQYIFAAACIFIVFLVFYFVRVPQTHAYKQGEGKIQAIDPQHYTSEYLYKNTPALKTPPPSTHTLKTEPPAPATQGAVSKPK